MSEKLTPATPELRHALVPFRGIELRDATATGDGSYTLTGYAAVFDQETVLYDGSWWRLREVIAPGAFTNVLSRSPDVHLNIGHDMTRAIARTGVDGIGGLELTEDTTGLRVFARLDPADPDVIALAAKMNRGIVDQMSFAFTVARAQLESEIDMENDFEDELRTILEIGELYDTAVCAQGAYSTTVAELAMRARTAAPQIQVHLHGPVDGGNADEVGQIIARSLSAELGRAAAAGQPKHRTDPVGATPVAPEERDDDPAPTPAPPAAEQDVVEPEAGDESTERARKRAASRMRIRQALND